MAESIVSVINRIENLNIYCKKRNGQASKLILRAINLGWIRWIGWPCQII